MMLNAGVLPLTHIDGTPIAGVNGEFYNVYTSSFTTGMGLNFASSKPPLVRKKAVVVCKATCIVAHYRGMRPPSFIDQGRQLNLTDAAVLINDRFVLVPWGLPKNVGQSFKAHFVFDSLPETLAFLIHASAELGGAITYSGIKTGDKWFNKDVKIYY